MAQIVTSQYKALPATEPVSGNRRGLMQMAGEIAYFLRKTLGLAKGDRVGILSPNSTLYAPLVLGTLRAGCTAVTLNPLYSSEELEHPIKDSGFKVLFAHPGALKNARDAFAHLGISTTLPNGQPSIWVMDESDHVKLESGATEKNFRTALTRDTYVTEKMSPKEDLAFVVYSSGTSGLPKGVMLTHDNMIANTHVFWSVNDDEFLPGHTSVGVLPFFHIFGLNFFTLTSVLMGVKVVVVPRFTLDVFCSVVQRYRCTFSLVVPPMLLALSRDPIVDKYDLSSLRVCLSGAAPLGRELVEDVQRRLPSLLIAQGYGLSETSPVVFRMSGVLHHKHPGSCGRVVPHTEVRLVTPEGKDVAHEQGENGGTPGEVWVRGRSVMKGYLNNPAATQDCLTKDGWFQTGDVAISKDGCFYIVDRIKELIKYKGFQVSPAELEDLLLSSPLVKDAAVVGVYSKEQATELPRAYVVPREAALDLSTISDADRQAYATKVAEWLDQQVANHKKLRGGVELIPEIPKSASGKILRRLLRDRANGK